MWNIVNPLKQKNCLEEVSMFSELVKVAIQKRNKGTEQMENENSIILKGRTSGEIHRLSLLQAQLLLSNITSFKADYWKA